VSRPQICRLVLADSTGAEIHGAVSASLLREMTRRAGVVSRNERSQFLKQKPALELSEARKFPHDF
jgi:hypothetical protein